MTEWGHPRTCSGIFETFSYLVLLSQERVRQSSRVMVWGKARLEVGRAGRERT